jgi:hypothetical protein
MQHPVSITVIQTPGAMEQVPLVEAQEVIHLAQATVAEARDTPEAALPEVVLLEVIRRQDPVLQAGSVVLLLEAAPLDLVQEDHLVHQVEAVVEDNLFES